MNELKGGEAILEQTMEQLGQDGTDQTSCLLASGDELRIRIASTCPLSGAIGCEYWLWLKEYGTSLRIDEPLAIEILDTRHRAEA